MKKSSTLWTLAVMLIFLALVLGCSTDDSMTTPSTATSDRYIVKSNIGEVEILRINTNSQPLAKNDKGDDDDGDDDSGSSGDYYAEVKVKAKDGGIVQVGNETIGYSKLIFDAYDLYKNTWITMEWCPGDLCVGEFGPDGLELKNTCTAILSYKAAEVDPEDQIEAAYWEDGKWKSIGGIVDPVEKTVQVEIEHFSRYAIIKTND